MLIAPHEGEHLGYPLGRDMVDIHEAQAREGGDVFLALAASETCCHTEAGHTVFVVLSRGHIAHVPVVTVFLCVVTHRLVGAHHRYQRIECDALGKRVGKTFE